MADDLFDIDQLLNNTLKKEGLKDIFDKKLAELKISKTNVQEILDIQNRTLNGILDGTQKMVDITNLIKIADFLQMPKEEVFRLYVDSVQKKGPIPNTSPEKIKFIKENFDLAVLKKAGLIESLTDFDHIEERITRRLGFKSIYEYQRPRTEIAFSSGLFKPKNILTRSFWIRAATCMFEEINNPHEYSREALIKFIPFIRWHTMNIQRGFTEVIKALFKLGVTIIFQPSLQGLQLRGATFNVNEKPCIVITNYRGFYSSLWFGLMHEIYHVLFDWQEIKNNCYHLTDDDVQELTVQEREEEADIFARDYLFSKIKLLNVKPYLNNRAYVREIAKENHVDESIIYSSYAFDTNDRKAWTKAKKLSPDISESIKEISYPWDDKKRLEEVLYEQKQFIYN